MASPSLAEVWRIPNLKKRDFYIFRVFFSAKNNFLGLNSYPDHDHIMMFILLPGVSLTS